MISDTFASQSLTDYDKMKAALISLGSISSKWTLEAMRKYFDEVDDIHLRNIEINIGVKNEEVLYEGKPLPQFDCIFAKGSFRYAPVLRALTNALSTCAYMPITSESFTLGHDKMLTHLALQLNHIPTPTTYLSASIEGAKKILAKVNYPIIMKFPQGTQGKGVMYAESMASASSMLDALTALRQPFLIQEYIETGGVDVRAIVVGDKIVAAMRRKAVIGEKRANIHVGGAGEAYLPDFNTKKIAVDTARSIGADICAVDILESPRGPLVIEANLSPGLRGITKATGIDVADKIARFLSEKTKMFKEKDAKKGAHKIMEDLGIESSHKEMGQIITHLDFRGERILLPKLATNAAQITDKDEIILKLDKGRIIIEKI